MAADANFLLGRGERLTKQIRFRSGFGEAGPPYAWDAQRGHLLVQMRNQQVYMDDLPDDACPDDQAVSVMTLHPQYYSRSMFPQTLLTGAKLRLVGSRPVQVQPEGGRGSDKPEGAATTAMFVAGRRSSFRKLLKATVQLGEADALALDLMKIESIGPLTESARIAGPLPDQPVPLEVVMHFDAQEDFDWADHFVRFAKRAGVEMQRGLEYQTRGLWFLAARGDEGSAQRLARFSFVRTIRPMPRMRVVDAPQTLRSVRADALVVMPAEDALDPDSRVAILDGGLPPNHPFGQWARAIEPAPSDGIGDPVADLQAHGVAVTSALLFGPVQPGVLPRPYCTVDHYRVLGDLTNDWHLFKTMLYTDKLLASSIYDFVNLSIGPAEVVGDDKVTAWTAMLDDNFQQGNTLACIAVGNDGDKPVPHNRVQVPSDCVNAIAVGATDNNGPGWARAPYSSIGPGRAPGSVRPELMGFGGVPGAEFRFLFPGPTLASGCGTSFPTPALLRTATGLRAHFGREIGILGLRALMAHSADDAGHPRREVGWGMPPDDLADITVCPDHSVRVLYQGFIDPAKVIRAEVPMPGSTVAGFVTVKATFCYNCLTDPNTPGDYTRSGLEICFRPHKAKLPKPNADGRPPDPDFPAAVSFFEGVGRKTEQVLRNDAFKWDTLRSAERRFRASSLNHPVFDVHHIAREPGTRGSPSSASRLAFALVVTVSADKHPSLYADVVARYSHVLEAIRPRTRLPTRIRR